MRCNTAQRLISIDLDGELDERRKLSLSNHLEECDSCRALASDFAADKATLDRWNEPDVGQESADRLIAKLELEEIEVGVIRGGWDWSWLRPARVALSAAALGFGVLLGSVLMVESQEQTNGGDSADTSYSQSFELIPEDSIGADLLALLSEEE